MVSSAALASGSVLDDPDRWIWEDDLVEEWDRGCAVAPAAPRPATTLSESPALAPLRSPLGPWERLARVVPMEEDPADDVALADVADDELLARLGHAEALTTQLAATQARVLSELRARRLAEQEAVHGHPAADCPRSTCCDPDGWVAMEASVATGLSERQVGSRLLTAHRLERFQETAAAMQAGLVQSWTGIVLLEHLEALGSYCADGQVAAEESAALAWLGQRSRTVGQLNARMRRRLIAARAAWEAARAAAAPEGAAGDAAAPGCADDAAAAPGCADDAAAAPGCADDAAAAPGCPGAEADRHVTVSPARVLGLAEVVALLPEADALVLHATLLALARERADADDPRTADQRRADLLVALVAGRPAQAGRVGDLDHALRADGDLQVHLDVTVPVTSLGRGPSCAEAGQPGTGTVVDVADVRGYGPVPAATAGSLASSGGTARPLVIDPATGALLGFGARPVPLIWLRDVPVGHGYQHPPTLDTALRLRDGTCRAPGCTRRAARCDCDHVVAYPRGSTTLANGCCLCRRHHRLKTHAPRWRLAVGEGGDLTWVTPTGATATTTVFDYR